MAQINLHITPDFERALEALMQGKKIASKSEAIRYAVRETAAPYLAVLPTRSPGSRSPGFAVRR